MIKTLCIAVILITGSLVSTFGQSYEKSSRITRVFPAMEETEIQISNKYGNIHLIPWEKDSVKFEIELKVKANKEAKVDKLFDNVDFDFTSTRYYVIATTTFQKSNIFTNISDMANTVMSSSINNVEIDYMVYFPEYSPVTIENKFGNIYSTDHAGKLDIHLSNGDFKVNNIYGDAGIKVDFGNIYINDITSGKISLSYGELSIKKAKKLIITSKSSRIAIDTVLDLQIDSRRDKLYLTKVNTLKGQMSFSYINIKNIETEFMLNSRYGDITLEQSDSDLQFFNLNSSFTDVQLFITPKANFNIEILHTSKTTIRIPEEDSQLEKEIIDKKADQYRVYGKIGKDNQATSTIKINATGGSVSIVNR